MGRSVATQAEAPEASASRASTAHCKVNERIEGERERDREIRYELKLRS
jgi:hypothetical protein